MLHAVVSTGNPAGESIDQAPPPPTHPSESAPPQQNLNLNYFVGTSKTITELAQQQQQQFPMAAAKNIVTKNGGDSPFSAPPFLTLLQPPQPQMQLSTAEAPIFSAVPSSLASSSSVVLSKIVEQLLLIETYRKQQQQQEQHQQQLLLGVLPQLLMQSTAETGIGNPF